MTMRENGSTCAVTGAIARDACALNTIEFVFGWVGRGVLSSAHCSIFSHYIIHFRPGTDAQPFRIHAHSNVFAKPIRRRRPSDSRQISFHQIFRYTSSVM